jgi:hypothetical protein
MSPDWHDRDELDHEPSKVHPLGWRWEKHPHDAPAGAYDAEPLVHDPRDDARSRSAAMRGRYLNGSPMVLQPATCGDCGGEWLYYGRADGLLPVVRCQRCAEGAAHAPDAA